MAVSTDRLAKQANKVGEDVQQMGALAKDFARDSMGQIRDNAAQCYNQGVEQVRGSVSKVGQYVRERPFQSLLMAAGAGLLLAFIWKRS